jgi:hypothetical protein
MSGMPILNAVRKRPTFALLLGKPKKTTNNGMPHVEFPNLRKIDLNKKTTNIVNQFDNGYGGEDIARGGAMLAASTPGNPNIMDTLQFVNAFHIFDETITLDQLQEGRGESWMIGETYEQMRINAMMIKYVNQTSINMFATGANKFAADGQLGSLRAYVSDGLTTATRASGSGTDESNYVNYAGYLRTVDDTFRANYVESDGAAYTEAMGDTAFALADANGAEHIVAPMSIARFNAFKARIRSTYPQQLTNKVHEDLEYALGGTDTITADGITYYREPALTAAGVNTWQLFLDTGSIAIGSNFRDIKFDMERMTDRKAAYSLWASMKHQIYNVAPNRSSIVEELPSL